MRIKSLFIFTMFCLFSNGFNCQCFNNILPSVFDLVDFSKSNSITITKSKFLDNNITDIKAEHIVVYKISFDSENRTVIILEEENEILISKDSLCLDNNLKNIVFSSKKNLSTNIVYNVINSYSYGKLEKQIRKSESILTGQILTYETSYVYQGERLVNKVVKNVNGEITEESNYIYKKFLWRSSAIENYKSNCSNCEINIYRRKYKEGNLTTYFDNNHNYSMRVKYKNKKILKAKSNIGRVCVELHEYTYDDLGRIDSVISHFMSDNCKFIHLYNFDYGG